jgi:hypothetical protein
MDNSLSIGDGAWNSWSTCFVKPVVLLKRLVFWEIFAL